MSRFDDLVFDIKIFIASFDADAWFRLTLIDDEFKSYSCCPKGIKHFKQLFTQPIKFDDHIEYKLLNRIHRDNDLPAIIYSNGTQEWYRNGRRHRNNDRPAVIYSNGTQEWFQNGQLHRDNDQPTLICANGHQEW